MPQLTIDEKGCRGCTLCVEICPAEVFSFDDTKMLAKVDHHEDCIGCFSCYYLCPSQCLSIDDVHIQRPFYRVEENVNFVERFLQEKTATKTLTKEDWEEAYFDVSSTTMAMSRAAIEMMGRGIKALGRKSGTLAAEHMPEMYDARDLNILLESLKNKFKDSFDFQPEAKSDGEVLLTFKDCAIAQQIEGAGEKVGEFVLCDLLHNYLAGLLSTYMNKNYIAEYEKNGSTCVLKLSPK